jgi:hypothetical protein
MRSEHAARSETGVRADVQGLFGIWGCLTPRIFQQYRWLDWVGA